MNSQQKVVAVLIFFFVFSFLAPLVYFVTLAEPELLGLMIPKYYDSKKSYARQKKLAASIGLSTNQIIDLVGPPEKISVRLENGTNFTYFTYYSGWYNYFEDGKGPTYCTFRENKLVYSSFDDD